MLSELRHNVFSVAHHFVSSAVLEVVEEFKKQSPQFAYARALTLQECFTQVKILVKKLVSGELLPGRSPYARDTKYYEWALAALFWELNKDLPSIRVLESDDLSCLLLFIRRILLVELYSTYTSETAKVDPEAGIYLDDPTLRKFLQGPDARFLYMVDHLLPLMDKVSLADALKDLNNLDEDEYQRNVQLVKQMVTEKDPDEKPGLDDPLE